MLEREDGIDAAMLDVNLGGEMAFLVADALAAQEKPFVITCGYDQAASPERHANVRRLEKPIETSTKQQELRHLLGDVA